MSLAESRNLDRGHRRLRILVVDDNRDVADCLAMLLRHLGHVPRICFSGRECLASLHEFRPQVILLDLTMPVVDGFETCRLIQQTADFQTVPVIACSALNPSLVRGRSCGCGFSHHLVKPVSLRQLQSAIEEVTAEQLRKPETLQETMAVAADFACG